MSGGIALWGESISLDIYEYVREINPGIRALLTSGLLEDDSMTQARDMGIMGFLQKPYSTEELSAKIAEILNKQHGTRPRTGHVPGTCTYRLLQE